MAKTSQTPRTGPTGLTRRERLIMDILYRRGRATAGEVMEELSGDPSYSTVRTQLRVLGCCHGLTTTVPTLPGWETWRTASMIRSSG